MFGLASWSTHQGICVSSQPSPSINHKTTEPVKALSTAMLINSAYSWCLLCCELLTLSSCHPLDANPPEREHGAMMVDVQEGDLVKFFPQDEKHSVQILNALGDEIPPQSSCHLTPTEIKKEKKKTVNIWTYMIKSYMCVNSDFGNLNLDPRLTHLWFLFQTTSWSNRKEGETEHHSTPACTFFW